MPFSGFLCTLRVKSLAGPLNPATKLYNIGYLISTFTAIDVYTILCKISLPDNVAETRTMPFKFMAQKEVLHELRA